MSFSIDEAKKWSLERLRFELDTLREELRSQKADLRHLEMEYELNPSDWGGSYPVGLDSIPREINRIKDKIQALEDIIRSKL